MLNQKFILVFDANWIKNTNFTETMHYRPIETLDPIELPININYIGMKMCIVTIHYKGKGDNFNG